MASFPMKHAMYGTQFFQKKGIFMFNLEFVNAQKLYDLMGILQMLTPCSTKNKNTSRYIITNYLKRGARGWYNIDQSHKGWQSIGEIERHHQPFIWEKNIFEWIVSCVPKIHVHFMITYMWLVLELSLENIIDWNL